MPVTVKDEWQPLDSFRPHPKNYNSHPERQVQALADAMRITAFTAPIICKPDGTILGGHARRLALWQLREQSYPEPEGIKPDWLVPCRMVTCNRTDELRILATDNPDPAQMHYDNQALASLLTELQEGDALEGTWYGAEDLDRLIGTLAPPVTAPVPPGEFQEYDETIPTDYLCPKCGFRFSGGQTAVPGAHDGGDSADTE